MSARTVSTAAGNPLFELQQTLYASGNYTRRRLHQARLQWVTHAIERRAPTLPCARAIEYGPGSGIYLPVLARHCGNTSAADIEGAYLAGIAPLLAELGPSVNAVVDDIQQSSFEDETFGMVLCSEVLEHVPDPELALRTLQRILLPGGIAIVTTPQRYSLMELCCKVAFLPGVIELVRLIYREPVLPTGHISLRSAAVFRKGIDAAGFEILEHERFGLYVPVIAEFGGARGGRLLERLESRLAGSTLDQLFWTQAYVLRKPTR
jgi:ubiquinone/menaquinone biosynthesis C-methylase UbiE